jgi:hypothetical protein
MPVNSTKSRLSVFHHCLDASELDFVYRGILRLTEGTHPLNSVHFRVNLVDEADVGDKWDDWFHGLVLTRKWSWSKFDDSLVNERLPMLKEVCFLFPNPLDYGIRWCDISTAIRGVLPISRDHGVLKITRL